MTLPSVAEIVDGVSEADPVLAHQVKRGDRGEAVWLQ